MDALDKSLDDIISSKSKVRGGGRGGGRGHSQFAGGKAERGRSGTKGHKLSKFR